MFSAGPPDLTDEGTGVSPRLSASMEAAIAARLAHIKAVPDDAFPDDPLPVA